MLSFITSLWNKNPSSVRLVDACDEHVKQKREELKVLREQIDKRNSVLSQFQANTATKQKAFEVQQYACNSFLQETVASLKNVSDAIREATTSTDADAIEQTILLMTSFSVSDFQSEIKSLQNALAGISEELELAKEEEEKELRCIRNMMSDEETLLKHIEEIENIQSQLQKEIVGNGVDDKKAHTD